MVGMHPAHPLDTRYLVIETVTTTLLPQAITALISQSNKREPVGRNVTEAPVYQILVTAAECRKVVEDVQICC